MNQYFDSLKGFTFNGIHFDIKDKIMLSLCLILHHAMKAYGEL